jgi:serine/threonine-protein kinase
MSSSEQVREILLRVGALDYAETIPSDVGETIQPTRRISEETAESALEVLAQLIARGGHALGPRYQLGEPLGLGGMGLVREAHQIALDRDVAVKLVRADMRSPAATAELLQEAWITGALEHPNVVPVHDIGVDADGNPVIVFKRIGGVTWSDLMANAAEVAHRFGSRDLLDWNLRILLQVINAVRFAHSRGIIHRDLKPDNVMIGEFGEVYVVDWGIAVSMRGGRRLPSVSGATQMAGTPCYMAPEMLGGADPQISERTDIYLLGAILHEIVTGKPPHEGETPLAVFTSVVESTPVLPDDTPPGLARICVRAMAADPAQRFAGAEDMQRAVQDFLQYRGSEALVRQAEADFAELRDLLGPGLQAPASRNTQARLALREQLYRLYGACRFGFIEALSAWRDNEAARAGLRAASEAMIHYELARRDPHAASALAADVAHVVALSPGLQARIDDALAAKTRDDARRAELERLGAELDIRTGARTRGIVVLCMGLGWVLLPLVAPLISHISDTFPGNLRMAGWTVGTLAMFALVVYVARRELWQSAINRRLVTMMGIMLAGQAVLHLGAEAGGIAPVTAQTFQFFYWFGVVGVVSIMVERRLFPTALAYLVAYFVVARFPGARFLAMGAVNTVLLVDAAVIWLVRSQADRATRGKRS